MAFFVVKEKLERFTPACDYNQFHPNPVDLAI